MQFLDRTGVGTLWSMCKTKFALAGHTHNSLAAVGNEQINATAYGSGLHFKPYYSSGGPTTYGNILEYTSTNTGGCQLAMEWTGSQTESDGTDSNVGRVYYRSKRDCINGWTKWMTLAYTNDIPTKLSQLTNDKGFVTGSVSGNTVTINGSSTTWTNTWRGIQDNLISTSTSDSLSANQGRVLKGLVDGKANSSHTHNYAGSGSPGGSANSAIGVVDYGQTNKTIQIGYSGDGITGDQIRFIAGYTDGDGNVNAKIKDVSKYALRSWLGLGSLAYSSSSIPTNLSQLNNDKGFVTGSVSGNTITINGASTTWFNSWRGIQDNLTSSSTSDSLSANQGRILKGLVDSKANSSDLSSYSQKSETIKSIRFEKNGYTQGNSKLVQVLHVFKANGEDDYLQMYNADSNINGLMSYQDKVKLDGIASGANNYSLPTATETTLGGIKVDFVPKYGNCRFKVQIDVNGNANAFIPGLKYSNDECLGGVQVGGDSHASVTYTGNGVTFNDQHGQKIGDVKFRGTNGYFALTSDIPDVSNLCRFNFVNSISECRSDRINFFLRCTDTLIRLDPFDSYPDGTILLITIGENAANIIHQSGRWYSDGDNVSKNYSCNAYKEEINLITKNNGMVHHYKFN